MWQETLKGHENEEEDLVFHALEKEANGPMQRDWPIWLSQESYLCIILKVISGAR